MELYNIIKKLEETPSSNKKLEILQENYNNEELKTFFKLCLDKSILFFQKKIPDHSTRIRGLEFSTVLNLLSDLSEKRVTGSNAIAHLTDLLNNCSADMADIVSRIIKKDPACKVSVASVNKIWENLIPEWNFMLCEKQTEKTEKNIDFPAISQDKADGMRISIIVAKNSDIIYKAVGIKIEKGNVKVFTRNGNDVTINDNLKEQILDLVDDDCVLDGEGLVRENGIILERKKGNGILNKCIQGTASKKEYSQVVLRIWDIINIDDFMNGFSKETCIFRLNKLENLINEKKPSRISLIEYEISPNIDHAKEFARMKIKEGKEGSILKNINAPWEAKRSKWNIKFKDEQEADLICTGFIPHKKNPNWIGSLVCESSCGKLKVNVAGLTESIIKDDPNKYIAHVIEVMFNSIIESKGKSTKSMFLPRYIDLRLDKDQAESLEEIETRINNSMID